MILVDTSVWIDHLRRGEPQLAALLESRRVGAHPFWSANWRWATFVSAMSCLGH
jgi:predicted nucleic acid-binding protein